MISKRSSMKSHVLIFMHGLGDTSAGWSFLSRALPSYPSRDLDFVFPDAPTSPVTCNGGMRMTSWFDIVDIPVTKGEPDTPAGYLDSIKKIHAIIDYVKASHNLTSDKIILGGFSQGGAMSLVAASAYPEALCGCICLSGWGLSRGTAFPSLSTTLSEVPLFIGHGTADQVTFKTYKGEGHGACEEELKDLASWIDEVTTAK
ncbi:hypothetical protein TrRE_jg795 [Triparma retinervis]|uniref:Phospholipase/carboxylesterase/thioesterase domain-containing protein n=1 Tax=Triparma retinervis TaxID=2557542 RepID=A0A9W7E125_9STRA|nr:hypothetical protein TrRE_jg795 [Triparma retinervis]